MAVVKPPVALAGAGLGDVGGVPDGEREPAVIAAAANDDDDGGGDDENVVEVAVEVGGDSSKTHAERGKRPSSSPTRPRQ